MKNCDRLLGDTKQDELYKYKSHGVLKNYVGSLSSNIKDKTHKKVGLIFASDFYLHKVNPLIYVKFRRHAYFPPKLFVEEF